MDLLGAFFKGSRFTAKICENFTGEMERAGDQNWIWFRACEIERLTNR
jgi:hypothetical protein